MFTPTSIALLFVVKDRLFKEKDYTKLKVMVTFKVTISVYSKLTEYIVVDMEVISESYKGIEFVRISSLEAHEKSLIWQTLGRGKVIKILRDNELLNDCIQYHDYMAWRNQNREKESISLNQSQMSEAPISRTMAVGSSK